MRLGGLATPKTPRIVVVFFALAFVVLTCVFPYNAALNNPNENVRVYMTMAIVEHHTFRIDEIVARQGWVNDMAKAPDPKVPGEFHYYSIKGPATGYAGVPFYWALTKLAPRFGHPVPTAASAPEERAWWMRTSTLVVRLFVVQLPCFLFLIWLERWLRKTTTDTVIRLSAVAAAGFGTNYLAYSLMFASHSLFAVAAFASFGITMRERLLHADARDRRISRAFLAGFFAGLATLLEYHALPVSSGLAIYALFTFWRPTRLALFALGGLLNVLALMFYQWRCYANPFTPGHKLAETQAFAAWHKQGFFGLGAPSWDVFRDLSISHTFGFFGTSPFMWLGLLAIPFGVVFAYGTRRERREMRWANVTWLLMMLVLWVAISCAVNWRGGWTVGPRFFGCAPPFFAFGAACALEWIARRGRAWRSIARAVAGGLALASVVQMGTVSLLFNSMPEDVTRPLPQIALPLLRAGFVPHHAAELFGWMAPTFWYVVLGCMLMATTLAALWPERERWWTYAVRVVLVPLAFVVGVRGAFSANAPDEIGDGVETRRWFAQGWEPASRDRISTLREQAERFGPRRPCLWFKVADLERVVEFTAEADRDEKRATVPRSECK
jgi:hypothetical protein